MGEKQCGKCGEMVDEAKAFCPGCGNASVEEKTRITVSDFDLSEHTVRLGDTMYNQMLSEMGLSISKAPDRGQKSIDTVVPAVSKTPASKPEKRIEPSPEAPNNRRAIVIGVTLIVIIFSVLAVIAIAAVAFFYFRYPTFFSLS